MNQMIVFDGILTVLWVGAVMVAFSLISSPLFGLFKRLNTKYYRIVKDGYLGFEVQSWCYLWPFWMECGISNTHTSIEKAEAYARSKEEARNNYHKNYIVKYLGKIDL